jgi:hypothetical protein
MRRSSHNRDAIGATVFVYAEGRRLSGEIQSGTSFLSQNDSRVHFGLAKLSRYNAIEVLWPGGTRERFGGGDANRIVRLTEGTGKPVEASASLRTGKIRTGLTLNHQ